MLTNEKGIADADRQSPQTNTFSSANYTTPSDREAIAHRALERPWTAPLEDHLIRHIKSTDLSRHIELSVRSAVKRQHIITARRLGQ
jgi:hypothetical protein